jgi:MFS transporter, DHA2 family, multidrug resistance protein
MRATASFLSGALGIAIIGSLGTAMYRAALAGAVLLGVSREAVDATRSNLGTAVLVATLLHDVRPGSA